jgi:hypothetical protein
VPLHELAGVLPGSNSQLRIEQNQSPCGEMNGITRSCLVKNFELLVQFASLQSELR